MHSSKSVNPIAYLSKLPIFEAQSTEFLFKIASSMVVRDFKARAVILKEGATIDRQREGLCIIVEGRVEISVGMPPSKSLIVQLLYEGDIFGECAMTTGQPRNATAIAAVGTRVLVLPTKAYEHFRATNYELTLALHEVLFTGLMRHQIRSNELRLFLTIRSRIEQSPFFVSGGEDSVR